jgi:DNA mismatch repair protein MSH2
LETRKDGVRFTTKSMKKISNQLRDVMSEYDELQEEIVKKVVELTRTYLPLIEEAGSLLAELDVLVSLATVAANSSGTFVRPIVLPEGSGILEFIEARHPCMEAQDAISFIPNDVRMEGRILLILRILC